MTFAQQSILTIITPFSAEFLLTKHGGITLMFAKPEITALLPFTEDHVHAYQLAVTKDINVSMEIVSLSQPATTSTVVMDINAFEVCVKRKMMSILTQNHNLNVQQMMIVDSMIIVLMEYVKDQTHARTLNVKIMRIVNMVFASINMTIIVVEFSHKF